MCWLCQSRCETRRREEQRRERKEQEEESERKRKRYMPFRLYKKLLR